jgi:hypothetical protein
MENYREFLKGSLWGVLLGLLTLLMASVALGATVEGLRCQPGEGGSPATSFQLWRRQPGESVFTVIEDQPVCAFLNQQIVDTGETCFKFAAKNEKGVAMRKGVSICVDPRQFTVNPPAQVEIK